MLKEKPFKVKGLRKGRCFDCKVEDNLFKLNGVRLCYTCLKTRLDFINGAYTGKEDLK